MIIDCCHLPGNENGLTRSYSVLLSQGMTMKCNRTCETIETVPDLHTDNPTLPPELAAHMLECPRCRRHFDVSRAWEKLIFAKIRDIKTPSRLLSKVLAHAQPPCIHGSDSDDQ
jgi:hypothetical protein